MDPQSPAALVCETFADVALAVATVAVVHRLDDSAVWALMRRLERLRRRTLDRVRDRGPLTPARPREHIRLWRSSCAGTTRRKDANALAWTAAIPTCPYRKETPCDRGP